MATKQSFRKAESFKRFIPRVAAPVITRPKPPTVTRIFDLPREPTPILETLDRPTRKPPVAPFVPEASRPAVPSSPGAIPGGPTRQEQEMGFGSILGQIIGVAEGITGIDIPFVGPGDAFFGGAGTNPAVPGRSGPLNVQGLPTLGITGAAGLCFPPFFTNPVTGKCEFGLASGGVGPLGGDPAPPSGSGTLHALSVPHHDTVPTRTQRSVRRCTKGSVLGVDGWCHPRSSIRNSDREWPRPRRPLLTGGDLNCIAKASRAASRLKVQTKRLQKMGMLPKPSRGR